MIDDCRVRPEGCICLISSDILCCAKGRAPIFFEILKGTMKEDFLTPSPRTPDVRAGLHKRSVYYG